MSTGGEELPTLIAELMGLKGLPHEPADLELDRLLGGHRDTLQCPGVLRDPCCTLADLENAEVAEFQPTTVTQFLDDVV